LLAGLVCVRPARADTEPIRIEYRAPSDCPDADAFNAEVFRRTTSARLATAGDQVRTFVVVLEQRRGVVAGSLRVRERGSETVAREVQGERCAEVAAALALATALAIDPNAAQSVRGADARAGSGQSGDARSANSQDGQEPGGATDAQKSAAAAATNNQNSSSKTDKSSSSTGEPDTDNQPSSTGVAGTRHAALALGPSLLAGVTPRVALGGSLSISGDDSSAGVWLTSLAVDLTFVRGLTSETEGAHSAFQLLYARPAACVPGVGSREGVWLIPCLGFELGAISGWGSDIDYEQTETRIWAALDVFLRLRVAPQRGWFLQAEAGAVVPFTRYDFVFLDPNTTIHSVPGAAFSAGLRFGVPLSR